MLIIAQKDTFSKMLAVELKNLGFEATISQNFDAGERFAVVDLDFLREIPENITAITYSRDDKNCDISRPFLVRNFRELVKARFFEGQSADRNLIITDSGVWVGEYPIELSKKERDLLMLLFENKNTPVYEETIREKIFSGAKGNVITVYIGYLRRKIDVKYSKKYIYTVRGGGYMLKM